MGDPVSSSAYATAAQVSSRYFPHRAAGFRANPFRALTDAEWAASAIVGVELLAAFTGTDAHIQLLGGTGAGKTTTLLGLGRLAEDAGVCAVYEYLAEGQDRLTVDLASCTLLLLDEAQRLSRSQLGRLLDTCTRPLPAPTRSLSVGRGEGGEGGGALRLVFASHADLTGYFEARGLPLVTTSVDDLPSMSWRAILDARLAAAALPGRPHATLSDDAVALLMQTFGADRRAAVALLYEVFQQLQSPATVDADHLRAVLRQLPG